MGPGHRLVGIYIDLAAAYDALGAQRTIHVHATESGRLLLKSPNPDCPLRVALEHMSERELRLILDALYARDEGRPDALEA